MTKFGPGPISPKRGPSPISKIATQGALSPAKPRGPDSAGETLGERKTCVSVDAREVLSFTAALLGGLPRGFSFRCTLGEVAPGTPRCDFVVVTSRPLYAAARTERTPTITASEWGPLAAAVEFGRVRAAELRRWLRMKRDNGAWVLTPATVFDAAFGCVPKIAHDPTRWTVGEVLDALGVTLCEVEFYG